VTPIHEGADRIEIAARYLPRNVDACLFSTVDVLGKSPLAFFQDLRVERAVHLLRTGHASVDQIAAEVGYAEGVTLRAPLRTTVILRGHAQACDCMEKVIDAARRR
jgi:transcriptional regulator GlxA family with amidase domain